MSQLIYDKQIDLTNMKLFIDTANLNHINELVTYNIISGVTTNPSLMAKEGISGKENCLKRYIDICKLSIL